MHYLSIFGIVDNSFYVTTEQVEGKTMYALWLGANLIASGNTVAALEAEITRAKNAEKDLSDRIASFEGDGEGSVAAQIKAAVDAEKAAREEAVSALTEDIADLNADLNDEISARTNADTFLSGKIDTNIAAIEKLNGGADVEGSVAKAVADAKSDLLGDAAEDYNTLGKLEDKIQEVVAAAKSYEIAVVTGDELSALSTNVREAYKLVDEDKTKVGEYIKIYKDSSLKSVALDGQTLNFTYIMADGSESTVGVDVSAFLAESEFANGLQVVDHVVSVKRDTNSEAFLSVGADGIKLSGVQNAINTAVATATTNLTNVINNLDKTVSGKDADNRISVTISQVDGKLSGVTVTSNDIATKTALQNEVNRATSAETNLTNVLNNTKLTSVTVNNITSQVANNKVSLTIDGGDILLDERYNPVSYPTNPSNKFTAVAYSTGMTIDNALHRVDHNTSTLVQEVVNNESATSQALAKVRQGVGLNSDGSWSKPTSGPASNASSLADAVAKLSSYIATLEQKIANLESQIK